MILTVVERQLETGDPPETGQTLDRLLALGYRRQEAIQLIGSALLQEIWWMLQVMRWNQETEQLPPLQEALALLDRALKWAWLARGEETHASGMYGEKLKEAIAILTDIEAFLESRAQPEEPPEERPAGMTQEEAEALARTIKARLPQAEVAVKEDEPGILWVVEARNPRRGTTKIFQDAEQFEQLMDGAAGWQAQRG